VPGVAREIENKYNFERSNCFAFVTPWVAMSSLKNVSKFGPAVWPAITKRFMIHIYLN